MYQKGHLFFLYAYNIPIILTNKIIVKKTKKFFRNTKLFIYSKKLFFFWYLFAH